MVLAININAMTMSVLTLCRLTVKKVGESAIFCAERGRGSSIVRVAFLRPPCFVSSTFVCPLGGLPFMTSTTLMDFDLQPFPFVRNLSTGLRKKVGAGL